METMNDLRNRVGASRGMGGKGMVSNPGRPQMPPGMAGKGGSMPNRPIPTPIQGGMGGKGGKFGGMG